MKQVYFNFLLFFFSLKLVWINIKKSKKLLMVYRREFPPRNQHYYLKFSNLVLLFMLTVCFLPPMQWEFILDLPKQSLDYPLNQLVLRDLGLSFVPSSKLLKILWLQLPCSSLLAMYTNIVCWFIYIFGMGTDVSFLMCRINV